MSGLGASTILPKKAQIIEDVSGATMVSVKAELFRAQEDSKIHSAQGVNAERRRDKKKPAIGNAGVSGRAAKDRAEANVFTPQPRNRHNKSSKNANSL